MKRFWGGLAVLCCVACGVETNGNGQLAKSQDKLESVQCELAKCGTPMGAPALTCPDGTKGGNTGRCVADAPSAACHWEIRSCSSAGGGTAGVGEESAEVSKEGTASAGTESTASGTLCGTTTCEDSAEKDREVDAGVSETTECAPGECGPALGVPAKVCADGSIGGNTGKCLPVSAGVCQWEVRQCP